MTNGHFKKSFLKEEAMSTNADRDAGFCSEEDYLESVHSPTDSSEDSVEVKVSPISSRNKRKCAEPRKVKEVFSGPLKKRVCLKVKAEETAQNDNQPFRPWSVSDKTTPLKSVPITPSAFSFSPIEQKPQVSYFRPPTPPKTYDEPVALIKKSEIKIEEEVLRVPIHPQVTQLTTSDADRLLNNSAQVFPTLNLQKPTKSAEISNARKEQRNYKNMTRERRIEANARERTRVHTISAAFETLRRSVPAYSHNQKLSKLSVLRIACSYIMTLSSLVSDDDSGPSSAECVDSVSRTIQREGKLRKKKDESD